MTMPFGTAAAAIERGMDHLGGKDLRKMKTKVLSMIVIAVMFISIFGVANAKAEAEQTGSLDELISANKELVDIAAGLDTANDQDKAETNEDSKEKTKVKWNDNFNKKDLKFMSCIVYCEAGNMGYDAKLAVANVVLNRMRDKGDYGHCNTVKEVIYDHKWGVQFSPTVNGSLKSAISIYNNLDDYKGTWRYDYMVACIEVAKDAFCGEKAIPDSFLYFNGYIDSSVARCKKNGKSYVILEQHIYF